MQQHDFWTRRNELVQLDLDWLKQFLRDNGCDDEIVRVDGVGGLVNSNFRVETKSGSRFLRIVTGDPVGSEKEDVLLGTVRGVLVVPTTIARSKFDGFPVVLQSWINGMPLKNALKLMSEVEARNVGIELGRTVGGFYRWAYSHSGFLDANAVVDRPFEIGTENYRQFVEATLRLCEPIMSSGLIRRIREFAARNSGLMEGICRQPCLVHGDFHPNNILVARSGKGWDIAGIVDWESAFAWTPLHDLAHLTRRNPVYRRELEIGLQVGFEDRTGQQIEQWSEKRSLLMVLSWLDKIAAGETRATVIESAAKNLARICA